MHDANDARRGAVRVRPEVDPPRTLIDREVLDRKTSSAVELYHVEHQCGEYHEAWMVVEYGPPRLVDGLVTTTRKSSRVILDADLAHAVWMEATGRGVAEEEGGRRCLA